MQKIKVSRPTIYILVAAIAISAWFLTSEETARRGKAARRSTSSATSNLPEGFTKDDLTANFEPLKDDVRDAFKPVVERKRGGSEVALAPNAVPSILTGGDPNWIYTGTAEIDGIPTGLIENKDSGEAEFLKQ